MRPVKVRTWSCFFPAGTTGPAAVGLMDANGWLRPMPGPERVCLRWAVLNGIEYAVWGGMGEDEHRAIKYQTVRGRRLMPETAAV